MTIGTSSYNVDGNIETSSQLFAITVTHDEAIGSLDSVTSTATLGNNHGYGSDVSTMIEKGDFIALRELALSYDLPLGMLRKIRSSGMNVFVSVFNVAYITKYEGLNPETYTGFDPGGYPRPRQFSIGGTLKF